MLLRNQKGLTLIEVLLSIVILTIILGSLMNFFPQMGLMNKTNAEKQQAVNLAKKELIYWQDIFSAINTKEFINQPTNQALTTVLDPSTTVMSVKKINPNNIEIIANSSNPSYDVEIIINTDSDFNKDPNNSASPVYAHMINIILLNKKKIPVSETYGYIFY